MSIGNIKIHYITTAQKNASEALSMAMQVWTEPSVPNDGIQSLVEIINQASIALRNQCISNSLKDTK